MSCCSRRSRGIGAILAAVFMLLILVLGFGVFLVIQGQMAEYQVSVETMNTLAWERSQESGFINDTLSNVVTDDPLDPYYLKLNLTVTNDGFIGFRLVYMGIENLTDSGFVYLVVNDPVSVNPGETVSNITSSKPLASGWDSTDFLITFVTERGSVLVIRLEGGVFQPPGVVGPPGEPGAPGNPSEPGPVKLENFTMFRFILMGDEPGGYYPMGQSWMGGQEVALGGYPANIVPNGEPLVFRIDVRNIDNQTRDITLSQFSNIQGRRPTTGTSKVYYIVRFSVDGAGTTLSTPQIASYTTEDPIVLPYNAMVSLYFSAIDPDDDKAQTTTTQEEVLIWNMALSGFFDDNTPFGQNIPFQSSLITQARIGDMTPTCGVDSGSTVTLTGSGFDGNTFVFWINADGSVSNVTDPANTPSPTSVTFIVPSASNGFYGIYMTDMVKVAYVTFDYTCP